MMSAVRSAMPLRFARWTFSLLVLALAALLPSTAQAQSTFTGPAASFTASSPSSGVASTLSVTGATGTVATVKVELDGVKSDGEELSDGTVYYSLGYAEFLLQAPNGEQFVLLYSTGDTIDGCDENALNASCDGLQGVSADTIVIVDGAHYAPNGAGSLGQQYMGWQTADMPYTVAPSSYGNNNQGAPPPLPPGDFPADYPQTDGSQTLNGKFAGAEANGTWTLYLIDNDEPVDPFSITGWKLTLTYNASAQAPTTTVLSSNANPATYANSASSASVTFTATVTSTSTPTGTVAFAANGSTIAGCGAVTLSGGIANCATTLAQGNNAISASYSPSSGSFGPSSGTMTELVEVIAANTTGDTWCNNSLISDPLGGNPGMAYPSVIKIPSSAYPGKTVANVSVELEGVQGPVNGIEGQFLLVAPGGTKNLDFLDQGFDLPGPTGPVNLTLSDSAGGYVPNTSAPASGTYLPTDDNEGVNPDTFPSSTSIDSSIPQVPDTETINYAAPYGADNTHYPHTNILTFGEAFNGASASGDWALYSTNGESLTVNNGWCLTLTLNTGTTTTTAVTSTQNPQTTGVSVTITATVTASGNPVTTGGTVTFTDTTGSTPVTLASNVAVNGSGQASFTTSTLTEGDHEITANYSGTSSDNASFGSMWQRINTATAVTQLGPTEWQYCNPGAVQSFSGYPAGPFTPNPSVISVTNIPGTLNTVAVQLTNFSVPVVNNLYDLASLVEGPTGAALDFFSNTTQGANGNGTASSGNYLFEDSAGGLVSSGNTNISPGPYKPTAYLDFLGNPDVFTSSSSGFYNVPAISYYAASHGSSTFASVFTDGSNANGTWSLFFNTTDGAQGTIGAANGWCVDLTEHLPTLDIAAGHVGTFTQGQQNARLTAVVLNTGPGSMGDPAGGHPLTVTDTLPTGLSYANNSSGSGWFCSGSGTVTCTNDSSIGDGAQYPTLTIYVNVANNAPANVGNSQSASGGGASNTLTSTDSIGISPAPVLSVTKTHTGTFTQGQTAEWDISVSNTLSGSTTNGTVTVSDTLPSGYSANNFGSTSAAWSCSGAGTVTCHSTSSISGGSSFPQIQVIVNVPAGSPTSVSNTAAAWGGGDLTHTNSGNAATGSDNNVPVVQVPASITANAGTTPQSATVTNPFGTALAVTVLDGGSNPINNASVTFTAPGAGASGTFSNSSNSITVNTNSSGVASAGMFTANTTPGSYSVTASVSGLGSQASFSLTNNPGAATHLSVSAPGSAIAGISFNITVTALDAFGNTATGYLGTVHFSSSDRGPGRLIPANFTFGAGNAGTITIPVTLVTAGLQSITATDTVTGSITGSASISVSPGPVVTIFVTAPSAVYAGAPFNFTVTAYDCCGNVATSYGGTVAFSSSDAAASLPASYTFLAGDAGSHTFSAAFNTVGVQTITATDAGNLLIATTSGTTVTIPNLVVTTAADDAGAAGNCNVQTTPGTGTDPSCSLRDALLQAGALGSGGITFDSTAFAGAQSILLTNGTLNIPSDTTITGPTTGTGATLSNLVTVNGNAASTVFTTNSSIARAAIANLAITNGSDSAGTGAGILNGYQASLAITNSTISGNTSTNGAGAIFNDYNASLTLTGSTLSGNSGFVGGIINETGSTLTVTNSTISGNSASNGGGGIASGGGTVTVTDSTISGNYAVNGGGGIGSGGGTVLLANTIVDGNWLGNANTVSVYDDFDDTTGNTTYKGAGGNVLGYYNNPQPAAPTPAVNLAPLSSYGGPTQTMLPLPGSPAICGGNTNNVGGLFGDQRGYGFDPNCPGGSGLVDAGAVQTYYGLSFTTNPPVLPSWLHTGVAISPAPAVGLTENGLAATAASSTITMTDSDAALGGTDSADLSGGSAVFSNLLIASPVAGDTLIATLSLNPALAPPLNLTASSSPFTDLTNQTISFTPITGAQYALTQLTLSATASSGLPVTFSSPTPSVCSVSGNTLSLLIPGTCIVYASQAGNSSYSPNVAAQSFAVRSVTQTISFTPITGKQYALTQLTLSATASSGLPVAFSSSTTSVCSVSGSTLSLLTPGTCVVVASQPGNGDYSAAPPQGQSFAVYGASQTITFPPITGTQYALTQLTLSATASSTLPVSFASTTPSVCSVAGSALSLLIQGTCIVQASQAGNGNYSAAPVVVQSFPVHLAGQTIGFEPITGTQYALTSVPLSGAASSSLPVTFSSTTTSVCTVAGTTLSLLTAGTCVIQASQAGNTVYAPAAAAQSIGVHLVSQTISSFPPVTGAQYAATQLTLSATASSGLPVTFSSTTTGVCTVSGSTLSLLTAGTCIVHASQAGSTAYSAATTAQSFAVHLASQTINFTPVTGTQHAATQLTLSATASSGLAVTFSSTTSSVCSVSGNTLSLLTGGTCVVHASQAGSAVYAPAATAQSFAVSAH
jgi:ribosomal protein S11